MKTMLYALMAGLLVACATPTAPSPSMGGKKKSHSVKSGLGGLKSSLNVQSLHPDTKGFPNR